jgi:hypothetical protein
MYSFLYASTKIVKCLQKSVLLTPCQFFAKLGELFNDRKGSDHGSVYLSQKRRT